MKASIVLLSTLLFSTALARCCKKQTRWSCCGVGPCNIFCCNCDIGMHPTLNDILTRPASTYSQFSAGCKPHCGLDPEALVSDVELLQNSLTDEEQHASADVGLKGYFTYEEYLAYGGVEDSPASKEHFDR